MGHPADPNRTHPRLTAQAPPPRGGGAQGRPHHGLPSKPLEQHLDTIDPGLAAILIPTLWALAAYRCWIRPALQKKDHNQ